MAKSRSSVGSTSEKTPSKTSSFSQYLPYIAAVASFAIITFIFFSPMITEDKLIYQGDIVQYEGASHEIQQFREQHDSEALWTNSMFGGMPAFQMGTIYKGNLLQYADKVLGFGFPYYSAFLFIAFASFFILLLTLEISPWIALIGGISYGLSVYNLTLLEAGHNTKMHTIALIPLLFAGAILLWRKKYLLGAAISAAAFSLLIYANHVQIAYYAFITLLIFGIVFTIHTAVKTKEWKHLIVVASILVGSASLGVLSNSSLLWSTYEYGNSTIRGKSELSSNKQSNGALDRDYAYQWSYGKMEILTLLIPNFYGGSSHGELSSESALATKMRENGVPPQQIDQYRKRMPLYWGSLPFTSGPFYMGAAVCFLFVLGLFVVQSPLRWWLAAATLLSVLLSFGHNLQWFSDLFFDYFPGYNKFRAVMTTLVIAQLTVPLLGFYALAQIFSDRIDKEKIIQSLYIAFGITGGVSLLIALFGPSLFSFVGNSDKQLQGQMWDILLPAIREDRASLMRSDAFRSFALVAITAGLLWAYIRQKVSKNRVVIVLASLVVFDMVGVGKRFINDDVFVDKKQMENPFQQSVADQQILADQSPNYRVYNTTVNSFNDASTSYHHKSVGGYHAAKLRRYQELIEAHISKGNMAVFDMLNTKYFIVQGTGGEAQAQQNPNACGNAWFVPTYNVVANADEEIKALERFDPRQIAFIDKRFESSLQGIQNGEDSTASIQLLSYRPNHLKYQSQSSKQSLAVFSEIFYEPGWVATIDGKETPIVRANYVLRALNVPAGTHEIEFKFQPKSYFVGEKVSYISSGIILFLLAFSVFKEVKKRKEAK